MMRDLDFIICDDGCRLHYQVSGPADGAVLLLSNSLGTSLEMWGPQIARLAGTYRVVRYDQRGHGCSDAPPGDYSLERLGCDVINLLDGLEVPRTHFCGISMGGLTGQWLAVNVPERIDRLILANTAAQIGQAAGWNERIERVQSVGLPQMADAIFERWFTTEFLAEHPGSITRYREILTGIAASGNAGCCAAIRDADMTAELHKIAHRTLIVAGLRDIATSPQQASELHLAIAGSQLLELHAAHLSNIELPNQFTQAVIDFLR